MPEERSFNKLVLQLAWNNTFEFLKSWLRDSIVGVLAILVGTIFFNIFGRTSDPLTSQVFTFLAYTSIPGGLMLVGIFFWYLGLAPFEIIHNAIPQTSSAKPKVFARVAPNYDVWKARDVFTVDEFAALLDAHEPKWGPRSPKAQGLMDLLIEQIELRKLKYVLEYGFDTYDSRYQLEISSNSKIKREEAISWAEAHGYDVSKLK